MIATLVFTDGRDDLLDRTIESYRENVSTTVDSMIVIHDDTGDKAHAQRLDRRYRDAVVIPMRPWMQRRGFGGAISYAWQFVAGWNSTSSPPERVRYLFHLEDDFTFSRPVDLDVLSAFLDAHREVAQVALRRQAWNSAEIAAGGVVELHPEEYVEQSWSGPYDVDYPWLAHRLFWTTNPSLYRASILDVGWPDGEQSEGQFTARLLAERPETRFAYWGARSDAPWVEHIGATRVGTGY